MYENILVKVPEEFIMAQSSIHAELVNNIGYFNQLLYEPCEVLVKTKILCIAVMMLVQKDIFSEDTTLSPINIPELIKLNDIGTGTAFEELMEWEYEFHSWCISIMGSLCMFGWEKKGDLLFLKGENPHDTYKNTYLSTYSDYFDELVELEKSDNIETEVFAYFHARLGKYMTYAKTHEVDKRLSGQITLELAQITNLFGASASVNSLKDYGFEVVYIHKKDPDMDDFGDSCYEAINILMPIHAANLEKLLDIAFERYPIESEE